MEVFGFVIDAPAASLIVMTLAIAAFAVQASRHPDSFWASAFKDENNKVTFTRLAMLVALAVSTWHLIFVTMNVIKDGKDLADLFPYYLTYLGLWSGVKAAEKALDAIVELIRARFGGKVQP